MMETKFLRAEREVNIKFCELGAADEFLKHLLL